MLAKPTKGVQIILKRFENVDFTCEFKYDGFRGQIHYIKTPDGHKVNVFSRNLEDMTESYPDVAKFFRENIQPNVEDFIMDSEIVAYDRKAVYNLFKYI
jgi:DNA ligase-1